MRDLNIKYFICDRCDENFSMETNLIKQKKSCTGLRALDPDKNVCNICDKAVSKKNFRRHYDTQDQRDPCQNTVTIARVYKAAIGPCLLCGRVIAKTNMDRQMYGAAVY